MYRSRFLSPDADPASGAPAAPAAPAAAPVAVPAPEGLSPLERVAHDVRHGNTSIPKLDSAAPVDPAAPAPETPAPEGGDPAAPAPDGVADALAAPEGTDPAGGAPAADALPEGFVAVELPNRNPGGEPVRIITDDPEVAERLKQVVNGYGRRSELDAIEQRVTQAQQQLEQERDSIRIDPIDWIDRNLSHQEQLGVALMTILDEKNWGNEPFQELLNKLLSDPTEVRTLRAELRAARIEQRETSKELIEQERSDQRAAVQLLQAVEQVTPAELSGERRNLFIMDARRTLADYVRQHRTIVQPADVPVILAGRLRAHGVDPEEAAARLRVGNGRRDPRDTRPAAEAGRRPLGGPARVEAHRVKMAVARVAPAGAGAPSATMPTLPKGATLDDANKLARQLFTPRS